MGTKLEKTTQGNDMNLTNGTQIKVNGTSYTVEDSTIEGNFKAYSLRGTRGGEAVLTFSEWDTSLMTGLRGTPKADFLSNDQIEVLA